MSPEERALRYWNSVRANYPNLHPDASDFWEACPTHLAKEFRAAQKPATELLRMILQNYDRGLATEASGDPYGFDDVHLEWVTFLVPVARYLVRKYDEPPKEVAQQLQEAAHAEERES